MLVDHIESELKQPKNYVAASTLPLFQEKLPDKNDQMELGIRRRISFPIQIQHLEEEEKEEELKDVFNHVLCLDHCSFNESNHCVKMIDHFTGGESLRRIEDCIIIDNNVFAYQKHLTNGILIPKFDGDSSDYVLS
mmetsp:Transcript_18908/g.18057  ORF Transcript_18908/g.18057 Transcript_18908/m.18057 type:complete len:136 (-) Transcript_18908:271-678(-)|eukprot:CAMPEP_0170550370 /NCGR_PEP_ID=MMETSP0211-20121228/8429_1 /TAXON_ID=311385 /ORGANISM="Pseudokeronopsis sp., Strain OXSARD2" /LENGTH=135 /DNA_ID=CAMNT_0010856879 /DNA_START=633 /DNA_END=1040 /DNA_ORIENTATION=+